MGYKIFSFFGIGAVMSALTAPTAAYAHEVYVLSPAEIAQGIATPAFSSFGEILTHMDQFIFWTCIAVFMVFCIFFISISRFLEKHLDPFFMRSKKYAPMVARVTIGLSFLAAAYYQALFGPEIPLAGLFGPYAPLVTALLIVAGILVLIDRYTRVAALGILALFGIAIARYGWYMLTYTNYVGEILILILFGVEHPALRKGIPNAWKKLKTALAPYRFFILRVAFGTSLLYASLYAKFIHNDLALQVASLPLAGHLHSLAYTLGFEPHFLVLGAGIVEIVIALFFLLGIEIRFTALFLEFWLTLSLLYFGEVVWPHLILIGIPIAFLLYGYDRYSLEGLVFKKDGREPVL